MIFINATFGFAALSFGWSTVLAHAIARLEPINFNIFCAYSLKLISTVGLNTNITNIWHTYPDICIHIEINTEVMARHQNAICKALCRHLIYLSQHIHMTSPLTCFQSLLGNLLTLRVEHLIKNPIYYLTALNILFFLSTLFRFPHRYFPFRTLRLITTLISIQITLTHNHSWFDMRLVQV